MRYFQTSNATRPYRAGGVGFEFEPVELIGGSAWLGVLVADEPAASILAGAEFPQVTELTQTEYDSVKKKIQERGQQFAFPASITITAKPEGCGTCGKNPYAVVKQ